MGLKLNGQPTKVQHVPAVLRCLLIARGTEVSASNSYLWSCHLLFHHLVIQGHNLLVMLGKKMQYHDTLVDTFEVTFTLVCCNVIWCQFNLRYSYARLFRGTNWLIVHTQVRQAQWWCWPELFCCSKRGHCSSGKKNVFWNNTNQAFRVVQSMPWSGKTGFNIWNNSPQEHESTFSGAEKKHWCSWAGETADLVALPIL